MTLTVLGFTTLVVTMLATLPATLVVQSLKLRQDIAVTGTAWNGEAVLANGDRAAWRSDLPGSILSLGWRSDLEVRGPLTHLSAKVTAGVGPVVISGITGTADWGLLRAVVPDIDLDCSVALRFTDATAHVGRSAITLSGNASSTAGACVAAGASKPFDVPATKIVATTMDGASRVLVSLASDPSALLAEIAAGAKGEIVATVQPLALKLVPGANTSGPVVYEMRSP